MANITKLPNEAGIGLRSDHHDYVIKHLPDIPWFEVHTENFFGASVKSHAILSIIAQNYPLSFHGVGLSLGSAAPISESHLQQVKELVDRYNPAMVSEHVSWSATNQRFMHDLLPLPYNEEALDVLSRNVIYVQEYLGRNIAMENPSSYLEFSESMMPEYEFMNKLAERTGCYLLLDINNIFVSCKNHGWGIQQYMDNINHSKVAEIHLAGHTVIESPEGTVRIDTHNGVVCEEVWELYAMFIEKYGKRPTLIEWDQDLPEFEVLVEEAKKAELVLLNP